MNIPGIRRFDDLQPLPVTQEALEQMQHDIRSPLCAILGLSEFLSSTASTPERQKIADDLAASSHSLNRHVDALAKLLRNV